MLLPTKLDQTEYHLALKVPHLVQVWGRKYKNEVRISCVRKAKTLLGVKNGDTCNSKITLRQAGRSPFGIDYLSIKKNYTVRHCSACLQINVHCFVCLFVIAFW